MRDFAEWILFLAFGIGVLSCLIKFPLITIIVLLALAVIAAGILSRDGTKGSGIKGSGIKGSMGCLGTIIGFILVLIIGFAITVFGNKFFDLSPSSPMDCDQKGCYQSE